MDLKKRFSEEQIIGFLQQAEAGVAIKELCRQHGFSVSPRRTHLVFQAEVSGSQRCGSNSPIRLLG